MVPDAEAKPVRQDQPERARSSSNRRRRGSSRSRRARGRRESASTEREEASKEEETASANQQASLPLGEKEHAAASEYEPEPAHQDLPSASMESHPVSARDAVAAEPPERAVNEREARETLPAPPIEESPEPTEEHDVEDHGDSEPEYYGRERESEDDPRASELEGRGGPQERDEDIADRAPDARREREPEERRERPSDERRHRESGSGRQASRYDAPRSSAPQPAYSQRQFESRERSRTAEPAAIRDAIDEVNRVIDSLKHALDDMEEVLETLELAERQKDADEQEIESLRRAIRQLQRPRDTGHRH